MDTSTVVSDLFDPAVAAWVEHSFEQPTAAQLAAWPQIKTGANVLIAAPTGSGKTLAAFLAGIDALVRAGREQRLEGRTYILYVSPLKALSVDVQKNLQAPLAGIAAQLEQDGTLCQPITAAVRSGDTTPAERQRMAKQPPHILVTTPESLYLLLTSESGRGMLGSVGTVIVDEIHALAGSKRGAHLLLSLARLDALCGQPPARIGLSATQKPIETIAQFLCLGRPCEIVDTGHVRQWDLGLSVPASPLTAVMSNEVWEEIYQQLEQLIEAHDTTLIFVNTRRLAERLSRHLSERLGREAVTAHHGSLAKEHRLDAEVRLKSGQLKALVATASLELGIDIGQVDLVCQLGSPRSIAALLQRVGRSGHSVGETPKGRLFPLSTDDLVECTALLDAVARGELDRIAVPRQPMDVLAQQIVAEVACGEWGEDDLYLLCRQTLPYCDLGRAAFEALIAMLADGFSTRRGRRSAHLHRDRVNGVLRPRRGARLTALTNGGTIPDQFDYEVRLRPQDLAIGTVNEDFAFESLPGDIFQLGNSSYRILKVETGRVYVEDAQGLPPNIPFWFGEAPGRSDELSVAVSRLRADAQARLARGESLKPWLDGLPLSSAAADQLGEYLTKSHAALGAIPHHGCLVLERFFDETGDMHLVIHSSYGSRVNRALGLSLRKRFCRKFNFELQASALEDSLVLSLGPTHSFPLDEVMAYLSADSVREVLIQALLDAPMFATRWRWVASIALAVRRMNGGKRRPPQFQRSESEDLIAVVFPDQLACQENITGLREVPGHPLVQQAIGDCLTEVMDVEGLERLLGAIADGRIAVEYRDLVHPSPLAQSILNARPYAFLDDGAAEERRTNNVRSLPYISLEQASGLSTLAPQAIAAVCEQLAPDPRNADELHDALIVAGGYTEAELAQAEVNPAWLDQLRQQGRAAELALPGSTVWVATERVHDWLALHPDLQLAITPLAPVPEAEQACRDLLCSRLEVSGPISLAALASCFALDEATVGIALQALEVEGVAVRGAFEGGGEQWCHRRILARIHQLTLQDRRRASKPVDLAAFMRFLLHWHGIGLAEGRGAKALEDVLDRVQGWAAPAPLWEQEILPQRMAAYHAHWLDELCAGGRFLWLRLRKLDSAMSKGASQVVAQSPVGIIPRAALGHWWQGAGKQEELRLSSQAEAVYRHLSDHGACFATEMVADLGLLDAQLEQALGELVATGLINSDAFQGIRYLTKPARARNRQARYRQRGYPAPGIEEAGRWALLKALQVEHWARCEHITRSFLRRYGVLFRALVSDQGLPPWRDLLYVCRRLEAREEIIGGRFVEGFSGEQFALVEAAKGLRRAVKEKDAAVRVLSASDPLNLTGSLLPGGRVAASSGNRLALVDGQVVACLVGGEVHALDGTKVDWALQQKLIRRPTPAHRLERHVQAKPPRFPRW